jgi:Ca-activated chloride channel family protein
MPYRVLILAACALLMLSDGGPSRAAASGSQDTMVSIEPRLSFGAPRTSRVNVPPSNFRSDSNLVLIPVNVVDVRDRQVVGLTREQFKVYDNQNEQLITHFASDDAPVSMAIVFDASASMASKLRQSREAIAELLLNTNPDDEFALIQFNGRVQRTVDLTDDVGEVLNRLSSVQSTGQTALLDAIILAVNTLKRARHPRKAVVLISDGGDNRSRYSIVETKQIVREADVQIFAVGIFDPPDRRARSLEEASGPELLQSIADETGGRSFTVRSADDLHAVGRQIGVTLRNEYLIGYSPSELARDGKYHRVMVRVDGQGLRLSWRVGYFAPGAF